MLTPEELEKLAGAESLFPSPIPVQFVSSDEYMPSPQSAKQKMIGLLENDKLAYCKSIYDKHGGERTNLAYGYINKG